MKSLLICLLLIINLLVSAQERQDINNFKNDTLIVDQNLKSSSGGYLEMPRVIPPSPEIAAIFKFVNTQISHSTGIADISIPLYTINCGNLQVPISINCHSGGRKYTDMTGSVGLGWILNAGGTISRTVYGMPDEEASVPINIKESNTLSIKHDFDYLAGLFYRPDESRFGKREDSEYDIFSYSLPDLSGDFVLYDSHPYSLSLNYIKIDMGGGQAMEFTITSENGTKYIFRDYETSSIHTPNYNGYNTKTAWHLNEIRSSDDKHVIKFIYENVRLLNTGNTPQCTLENERLYVKDMANGSFTSGVIGMTQESKFDYMLLSFTSKRLKEIDFGTGKVIFDIENVGGKINKMSIKDAVGKIVKSYDFSYSFLDKTMINNYKLDKLISNANSANSEVHDFEYYPTSASYDERQCDYWGYINRGSFSSIYFIPAFDILINGVKKTAGHYGIDRSPDAKYAQSGVLKKITYPTGGSTEYIYEGNKYVASGGYLKDGPGLRIKQIKKTNNSHQSTFQTFDYSEGMGSLLLVPDMRDFGFESICLDVKGTITYPSDSRYYGHYRQRVFPSSIPSDVSFYGNQPIYYRTIVEYKGDQINNTGKIEYNYSDPNHDSYLSNIPWPYYPSSYPQYYPANMPKSFETDIYSRSYKYIYQFGSFWKNSNLTYKKEYSNTGSDYVLMKSTSYNYKEIIGTPLKGLKIFKYLQVANDYSQSVEEFLAKDFGMPVLLFTTYYITRGRQLLSSIEETEYRGETVNENNVKIETNHRFTYNSKHLLSEESIDNSSGITRIKRIKYYFDDEYQELPIYEKMKARNMLNIPIQEIIEQNGKRNSIITVYDDYNGIIKPSHTITQKNEDNAEVRIQVLKYDEFGNPIYVTKDEVTKIVYIWGYGGQYPVAMIINASYDEVKNALGCTPESLSNSLTFDSRINNLRTYIGLSHSQIFTYKYKPLVGLIEMINERGISIYYDYDSFGRLTRKYFKNNNKAEDIEYYEYHTVN